MIATTNKTAKMIQVGDLLALKFCSTWLNDRNSLVVNEQDGKPRICDTREKKFIEGSTEVISKEYGTTDWERKFAYLTCADGNTYRLYSDASRIITVNHAG
jgi:hypothetical protein